MRRIKLILTGLFLPLLMAAQSSLRESDSITFSLYSKGDWKGLIHAGRSSIHLGYDYYYLRMRMGIAYYTREDYFAASREFRNALKQSKGDITATKYLFYAYLFSGRQADAREVLNNSGETVKSSIPFDNQWLKGLDGYSSYQWNLDANAIKNFPEPKGNPAGYQTIPLNMQAGYLGLTHRAGKTGYFYHQYTYLSKTYFQYYLDETGSKYSGEKTLSENLYFLAGSFRPWRGGTLISSLHYINLRIPLSPSGKQGFGKSSDALVNNSLLVHTGLYQYFGPFNAGGGISYSNLGGAGQLQESFRLSWFPMGNLNLYFKEELLFQQERVSGTTTRGKALGQTAGFKLNSRLWAELNYLNGNLHHFNLGDGLMVYNNDEYIKQQFSLQMYALFPGDRLRFQLGVSYNMEESRYIPADVNTNYFNPISVRTGMITGGLSWIFGSKKQY